MTDKAQTNYFLEGGRSYAANRPTYPAGLADMLAKRCADRDHALDVGCGTGQLSILLAEHFDRVTATDPSASQINNATRHARVTYRAEPAERIGLSDASVDLVTAAQAAHWFDLDRFYAEVHRVLRPDGIVALVSYGVPTLDGEVGERFARFYWSDIHRYWPKERRHVEEGYGALAFPFPEEALPSMVIERAWTFAQLIAYVTTWSATKRAVEAGEAGLIDTFAREMGLRWGLPEETRSVRWPVVGRIGHRGS